MRRNANTVGTDTAPPLALHPQPTWIFTHRQLPTIEGVGIRLMQGDVRDMHTQMRKAAGAKNIWIAGGGDLTGQFHDAGLLDELIIQLSSVPLGKGKQVFPRLVLSPTLRLTAVRQMGRGMVELRYEVGG